MKIPFNIPWLSGDEEQYMLESLHSRRHCGNHSFGEKCIDLMKEQYGFHEVFLVPSGTDALEMGALLAGVEAGDEVIMPSYTFSSTANAIVLRGATPVFCDITPDTMNIDVDKIETLITEKTKMILPIDYAGIPCRIDRINAIAKKHELVVMDDAAQSFHSFYNGEPCGKHSDLATFSFHETKNLGCGEGGALVVNRPEWVERAHFLQEKGTDRSLVLQGLRSKYGWVDKGSSFLLSDILAAMLYAQLQSVDTIVQERGKVTEAYKELYRPYEKGGCITIPHALDGSAVNHHAFFVIFDTPAHQQAFLSQLRERNVYAYIGYVPLHSFKMGLSYGYKEGDLPVTDDISKRIVRLPFYTDLAKEGLDYCVEMMAEVMADIY